MKFLLFYVLRRFFLRTSCSNGVFTIDRGFILHRTDVIRTDSITATEYKRTLLLRLLRSTKVTVRTLSGKATFYIGKDETLPFLPKHRGIAIRPDRRSVLFGAFTSTRALSGVVVFSLAIYRLGSVLGDSYYTRLLSALFTTAEELDKALRLVQLTLPRISIITALFIVAAWLFAFVRKVVSLSSFSVSRYGDTLTVRHGAITLYEYTLCLNDLNAVIFSDDLSTLLANAPSVYVHGIMVFPPVRRPVAQRLCRMFFGITSAPIQIRPSKGQLIGHIALPLGIMSGFFVALILSYIAQHSGYSPPTPLLRSILWTGILASLWLAVAYGIYMLRTGIGTQPSALRITARKGARLLTAIIPQNRLCSQKISGSILSRRRGICDYSVTAAGKLRLKVRRIRSGITDALCRERERR